MPTLLYNLELTEEEIFHLWALLAMRTLNLGPISIEEVSMLEKVGEFMNQ
jgi:hypothetical protein